MNKTLQELKQFKPYMLDYMRPRFSMLCDDIEKQLEKKKMKKITIKDDFKECKECSEKPGSPALCESCLYNRELVSLLKQEIEKLKKRR